jgi:hypothetical protein
MAAMPGATDETPAAAGPAMGAGRPRTLAVLLRCALKDIEAPDEQLERLGIA